MKANDAAGVLAPRPGLAAIAGRPAGVALRALRQVEDLVHVVARKRHLARAHEIEVVLFEAVDLGGVLAEEPGAAHDLGTHQRGRDHRDEPSRERALEAEVHERDLETRPDAGEECEPRPRDLGSALHVDRAEQLAQLEVVARLEVEGGRVAVRAQRDEVVFAARGDAVDDDVLDPRGAASDAASAAVTACWASLTRSLSSFASATRAAFSSLGACATRLPCAFCAARSSSKAVIASRRSRSATTASSTVSVGSPRASCERFTSSGFSRSIARSITSRVYQVGKAASCRASRRPPSPP